LTVSQPLDCMFDTVVFNRILDGVLPAAALAGSVVAHATHVQRDEIAATKEPVRRTDLTRVFTGTVHLSVPTDAFVLDVSRLDEARLGGGRMVPTVSAVWDVSRLDEASWAAEDGLYSTLKEGLDELNRRKRNNIQDALIAETAIKNRLVLVTDDSDLAEVASRYGGRCMSVAELLAQL